MTGRGHRLRLGQAGVSLLRGPRAAGLPTMTSRPPKNVTDSPFQILVRISSAGQIRCMIWSPRVLD